MQKYAYRIRKIQAQMGIKSTDFNPEILDENTVMLIDKKYRLQEPQDQELDNVKESRIETTELNYEEIMTGPATTVKMPDPRENIFTSHYLRRDKSCPSPVDRSLPKIDKKGPYYNKSCPSVPPKQKYTDQVRINTHITPHNSQGHPPSVKHYQNNFAILDSNQPPVYQAIESKSPIMPAQDPIYTKHENTSCFYDSSESQSQKSKKNQGQNNFAILDSNQPPVYQAIESKSPIMPAQEYIQNMKTLLASMTLQKVSPKRAKKNQGQNNFAILDSNQPPVYQAIESKSPIMPAQDPIYTKHENALPMTLQKVSPKRAKKAEPIQRRKFCAFDSQL